MYKMPDVQLCYSLTVPADGYVEKGDVKSLYQFLLETSELILTEWPFKLAAASLNSKDHSMIFVFNEMHALTEFRNDWYRVRAEILAQSAMDRHPIDPNDIPF